MAKHRRETDKPKPGDAGAYDSLTPEQKAEAFAAQLGRSVTRAADKRLKGEGAYADEPTSKKWRFGRKS